VFGLALTHVPIGSRVTISNSLIVGSITAQDCADQLNTNTLNIRLAQMSIPGVSDSAAFNGSIGRAGLVFPTMSRNNYMPIRSWTGIGIYPSRKSIFM